MGLFLPAFQKSLEELALSCTAFPCQHPTGSLDAGSALQDLWSWVTVEADILLTRQGPSVPIKAASLSCAQRVALVSCVCAPGTKLDKLLLMNRTVLDVGPDNFVRFCASKML